MQKSFTPAHNKTEGNGNHHLLFKTLNKYRNGLSATYISSETVNFLLPLALLALITLRPLAVAILSLKPCLLRRFLFDG